MINVSAKAATVIDSSSRTFLSRFLYNGKEVIGDVRSVIIYKGSCGESAFAPGSVYSSYIDVVIDNCNEDLAGKELTYQVGVVISGDVEWYDIGKYTVHKPSISVYTTSFTGLGRISAKLGKLYTSKLKFPTTIQNVLTEISEQTGISIDASLFDTSGVIDKEIGGYMYKEVLAVIAGIFFGYVTEDSAGNVVFGNYKYANKVNTDGDRTSTLPSFADCDTEIKGVKVTAGEISTQDAETGEDIITEQVFMNGSVNVSMQNEFMTQALFDANVGNIVGYMYRPANVTISLGDFRIEPFDYLEVTDSVGVVRNVPCMSIIHRFDGGLKTEIVAPELQDSENSGNAFRGLLTQTVSRYYQELISVKTLLAGKISADFVDANYAKISDLDVANAQITELSAKAVTTDKLSAKVAELGYAKITELTAVEGKIDNLTTIAITTTNLESKVAELGYLTVENAALKYATIDSLNTTNAKITDLSAIAITTDNLSVKVGELGFLKASDAKLVYATIESLDTTKAKIDKLSAIAITTDNLSANVAKLGYLEANKLEAEVSKFGYLKSSVAEITYATIKDLDTTNSNVDNLTARVGDISVLMFGTASGSSLTTEFSNSVVALISDASISSAKIISLVADKITSGSLNTNNVTVKSENGRLQITGDTILVKDANRTRVQIGKDSNSDYNIYILDSSGNVMFDATGVHADAIKSPIIEDAMVSEDANISASKLDIDSLFNEINGSTNTIKSTRIYLDEKNQSLEVAFGTVETDISDLKTTVKSHGTSISIIQGQIASKIWMSDILEKTTELGDKITIQENNFSVLEQSVDNLKTTVASHTSQIAEKADDKKVTEISDKVVTLEQGLDGFKTEVSVTYTTKEEFLKAVKETHRYYTQQAEVPEKPTTFPPPGGIMSKKENLYAITWNGDTTEKYYVDISGDGSKCLYHVSDVSPTIDDFASGGSLAIVGTGYIPFQSDAVEDIGSGLLSICNGFAFIIPSDNLTVEGITFQKKGTYFVNDTSGSIYTTCLVINKYTSLVINKGSDTIAFDNSLVGKEYTGSDTSTWIKISDSTPSLEDLVNGGFIVAVNQDGTVQNIEFTQEDFTIESDCVFHKGALVIIAPYDNMTVGDLTFSKGTYVMWTSSGNVLSFTINGYAGFYPLKSISLYGDTIAWDGDPTGLYTNEYFAQITDIAPTPEDFANGATMKFYVGEGQPLIINFTSDQIQNMADGVFMFADDNFGVLISQVEQEVNGLLFKKGLYFYNYPNLFGAQFFVKLTVNGYTGFVDVGWSEVEPAYVEGKNLYTVNCDVFIDDTFLYSDVSKVGAYEGANNAAKSVGELEERVKTAETKITQTENSITSQATEISKLGTRMSTVEQTASGLQVSLQETNNNVSAAQSTADTAKTNAENAQTTAMNAEKTATNFMSYDSTNGLLVGNKSSGSWNGYRTQMKSDSFNILDADGNEVASYGANSIELGKNNEDTVIELCGGHGQIKMDSNRQFLQFLSKMLQVKTEEVIGDESAYTNYVSGVNAISDSEIGRYVSMFCFDQYVDSEHASSSTKSSSVDVYSDHVAIESSKGNTDPHSGVHVFSDHINMETYTAGDGLPPQGYVQVTTEFLKLIGDLVINGGLTASHPVNMHVMTVSCSNALTLSTSVQKVLCSNVEQNCSEWLSASGGGIKCGLDGYILVFGYIYAENMTAGNNFGIRVYKNTTNYATARIATSKPQVTGYLPTRIIPVTAGDVIYIYATNYSEAIGTIAANTSTMFTVMYIG